MNNFAIRTEGLSRSFGATHAVDGLSLTVPAGIVFGFLGPNGSGKTTTIRLLLGLLEPTSGRAEVLGYDTRRQADEIRQRTAALLEHTGLYERLSAEENLEFFGRVPLAGPAPERVVRIKELLGNLGLWERRREAVGGWSRGMKQKLAVARTLLGRPSLIFLDEPTAGLDPLAAAALRDDLHALVEGQGVTVFLTTHNLAEAEKLCAQVGVIRAGRLLAVNAPDRLRSGVGGTRVEISGSGFSEDVLTMLRSRPEVAAVERQNGCILLDLQRDAETSPLIGLLVAQGVQIEEVRKGSASLEEAFLALVDADDDGVAIGSRNTKEVTR